MTKPTFAVPDGFARTMAGVYGTAGVEWVGRLPAILAECARRWSLTVGPPFTPLSYNYVAPAVHADGTRVVLKVGFPSRELFTEIDALQLYGGHGAVQLLAADRDQGALLLERLEPGTPLSAVADDEGATTIAAGVMRQIWRPVPEHHTFPSVADWAAGLAKLRRRFGGTPGPLSADLVEEAESLFAELIGSMAEPVVLHGDLHHDNILAARREPWLAIDPKGLVGEPAYEVGALLRNPIPGLLTEPQPGRILARRVDQLAERLGFDRARIRGWGMAQAVLAAWWDVDDDNPEWHQWITCAELIAALPD